MLERAGDVLNERAEEVYGVLAGEEDERACDAIPEEACREVPGSFVLNALNGASTKLAEQLASPGLVLLWMLGAVGAMALLLAAQLAAPFSEPRLHRGDRRTERYGSHEGIQAVPLQYSLATESASSNPVPASWGDWEPMSEG